MLDITYPIQPFHNCWKALEQLYTVRMQPAQSVQSAQIAQTVPKKRE